MAEDVTTSAAGGDVPRGGADHGKMSAAQKILRDAAIVAALHAGVDAKEVAKDYGITARSVRRVFAAFSMRPTAVDQRPMEIIERVLRTYEQQMRSFAALAENTLDRAPAVAVAALKGHADALDRYLRLLADIGKLPDNLELFRAEGELNQVAERMERVLLEVVDGEKTALEAWEEFSRLMRPDTPLWDADGTARELEAGS